MRKFKHKQTGIIGEVKDDNHLHYTRKSEDVTSIESIPMIFIENSNDWEEVVEKDYEILSFKSNKDTSIMNRNDFGSFGFGVSLDKMLYGEQSVEDGRWEIYSVKRLSDGEIFTIGDRIRIIYENGTALIKSFSIKYNLMIAFFDESIGDKNCPGSNITLIEKTTDPIFTTSDGVDVFASDEVIILCKIWINKSCQKKFKYLEKIKRVFNLSELSQVNTIDWEWFFDEKKADEYIEKHKPKFSISDIESAYTWDKTAPLYQTFINNLKAIESGKQ